MRKLVVIPAPAVVDALRRKGRGVMDIVANTYLLYANGKVINPDSQFLRFPDHARNRIIALPACIMDAHAISGVKWIASYPDNLRVGLPRASGVLILNDFATGSPLACIEASHISGVRTAASAALAARHLAQDVDGIKRAGFVGAGFIATETLRMLRLVFSRLERTLVHDVDAARAAAFCEHAQGSLGIAEAAVAPLNRVFDAELVVLATTATVPHLTSPDLLHPGQIVLHISLRDLAPELILASWNLVDDVDHCLQAQTSPHLALQATGSRDFIAGTLAELMLGKIVPDRHKPLIFSPFGLGALDLAVGRAVLADVLASGDGLEVQDFFAESAA